MNDLSESFSKIEDFQKNNDLTNMIAKFENYLQSKDKVGLENSLQFLDFDADIFTAAVEIKRVVGQIDVTIHAWGILRALNSLLEPDEKIESLSLGAGNTGKNFDLSTNKRDAEFKFIDWKGGSEAIRQNSLFKDFYNLAENGRGDHMRCLYVLNTKIPLKFLNNNRSVKSVLSKNTTLKMEFEEKYPDIKTVSQYYHKFKDQVEIIDIRPYIS